jgi:nucleotide-binding universal stress UspA family protein
VPSAAASCIGSTGVLPKRILWPTDFLESDPDALAEAVSIARASGAELLLLHVVGDPAEEVYGEKTVEGKDRPAWALWRIAKQENEQKIRDHAAARLGDYAKVRVLCTFGDPATRIMETARDEEVDLIVVSARRKRSLLQQMNLGAVTYKVSRLAPCNVLIVR